MKLKCPLCLKKVKNRFKNKLIWLSGYRIRHLSTFNISMMENVMYFLENEHLTKQEVAECMILRDLFRISTIYNNGSEVVAKTGRCTMFLDAKERSRLMILLAKTAIVKPDNYIYQIHNVARILVEDRVKYCKYTELMQKAPHCAIIYITSKKVAVEIYRFE